jgi:hypothetical protein
MDLDVLSFQRMFRFKIVALNDLLEKITPLLQSQGYLNDGKLHTWNEISPNTELALTLRWLGLGSYPTGRRILL